MIDGLAYYSKIKSLLSKQDESIMYKKINLPVLLFSNAVFLLATNQSFAGANFTIIPDQQEIFPVSVYPGGIVSAYYTVTNQTRTMRKGYKIQAQPATVTQNSTNPNYCSNPVKLNGNASCTLQLDISGEAKSGFALCNGSSCTTASVPLNVSLQTTVTVGSYLNSSGGLAPLGYYGGGIDWKLSSPLALPADVIQSPAQQNSFLNSIYCNRKVHYCAAVGAYTNNAGGPNTFAPLSYFSTDNGAHWKLSSTLPLPTDVSMPADNQISILLGVTSTSSEAPHYAAVGYYDDNAGGTSALSYISQNGGEQWELSEPLPLPSDVITPSSRQNNLLYGISCDPTGELCSAIGSYKNINTSTVPLSYTSTNQGRSWTLSQVPLPVPTDAPSQNQQKSVLQAISCNSGGHCAAVGYYYNTSTGIAPLSYISNDGGVTWQLSLMLPLPADVITPSRRQKTYLNGVFCGRTGLSCSAVGYYTNSAGTVAPLSYTSVDGGYSWTVSSSTLPLPSDAATGSLSNAGLFSVICDAAKGLCNAVGYYTKMGATTGYFPLSYTSTDGGITWAVNPNGLNLPVDAAQVRQTARLNSVN